jgi:hypothetical protein
LDAFVAELEGVQQRQITAEAMQVTLILKVLPQNPDHSDMLPTSAFNLPCFVLQPAMKTKSELSMASTETVGALRAHASAFFQHPGDYLEVSQPASIFSY